MLIPITRRVLMAGVVERWRLTVLLLQLKERSLSALEVLLAEFTLSLLTLTEGASTG